MAMVCKRRSNVNHLEQQAESELARRGELAADATERAFGNEILPREKGTILFVEDERLVREVASEVLRSAGYAVLVARNAAEALEIYERFPGHIDLLLTDVVMPGKNGRELATELRGLCPTIKTLFTTGYAAQMTLRDPEDNMESYLAKPFSAQSLARKVREVLVGR